MGPNGAAFEQGSGTVVVESCNTTWLFDTERMRFRRLPRGMNVDPGLPGCEWTPYRSLEFEDGTDAFVVSLNDEGTWLLRSWRHGQSCACAERGTPEPEATREHFLLGLAGSLADARLPGGPVAAAAPAATRSG
ncbi:MAG: hypothetical protein ACYDH5_05770 [Acidimicrobiales bacterium]